MLRTDVVISGIGGRFPRSTNIEEFSENLLAGKSLLEPAKRWIPGALGTPQFLGHTDLVDKFDNAFFAMHYVLSSATDATTRIALETAFEALVDAGVSPSEVRGTNAHVYSATSQYENDCTFGLDANPIGTGYTIMGRNKCMISNRVSHLLNLSGRSCSYDASGGWLGVGLQFARNAILSGDCDTAFVLGSSFLAVVEIGKQKQNMGLLSPDDTCHPFDKEVNGVTRSEAQVAFLVQRADIAKRSYGSIIVAESESQGHLPNWFLSVNEDHLRNFVNTVYRKNGVDPSSVKLIEADGLCNKEMIESEMNVLDGILNKNRPKDSPLYVGSVKTIMGDSEGAAGHASLTKLILAMETGIISPTINCGELNPNIRGLTEGRFKVVTEPTEWEVTPNTHVAVSHLSHSGVISHVVLKANGKVKDPNKIKNSLIPYLIFISGRNESIVGKSLQRVTSSPFDPEFIRLTQEVFTPTIDRYDWKGYGFHGQSSPDKFVIQRNNRRPVWFVYSGMGSQWPEMGRDLLNIPVINDTFQRLHRLLEYKGLDLLNILTSSETGIFDNILHSFVGITATQIALTNLLKQLGIEFDGIIGHSVGELGCSYADGCLTEEQTILAAYERGMASLKAELIPGLMAAVGLGYRDAKDKLPADVFVACRNSSESCTISGPAKSVKQVIASFNAQGIFVRGVNVSNIAYHSPYIRPAAPYLLESLRKVIPFPKLRSSKWVCTSAPREKWDSDEVRYCSADYHTNNLLNSVLFEEGSALIPKDALIIEVAPHGLLQAILKRSLGGDAVHVPLTRRGATSPSTFLLEAVGKMYLEGLSPKIWHLYPAVQMPVSRNTPSLVPLIAWEHDETFPLNAMSVVTTRAVAYELSISSPSMEIAGTRSLLPTYALVAVWETISKSRKLEMNDLPIIFQDVYFNDLIALEFEGAEEMVVNVLFSREEFEITRNEVIVVRGKFHAMPVEEPEPMKLPDEIGKSESSLYSDDIYSELKNRCVGIYDDMKLIRKISIYPQDWIADVTFTADWSRSLNTLLTMFQLHYCEDTQSPSYVSYIHKLVINPSKRNENRHQQAHFNLPSSSLTYNGTEMSIVKFKTLDRPELNSIPSALEFVPYGLSNLTSERHFLCHLIQLSQEKRLISIPIFKIYDVDGEHSSLAEELHGILKSEFSTKCELVTEPKDATLVLCGEASISGMASIVANEGILLLSRCKVSNREAFGKALTTSGLHTIAEFQDDKAESALLAITNKLPLVEPSDCKIIKMGPTDVVPSSFDEFSYDLIILLWEKGTTRPIEKIFRKVSSVQNAEAIRLVFLMSEDAPPFSLSHPLYADQMGLNVPVNVYRDGEWGCFHLIPLGQNYLRNMSSDMGIHTQTLDNRDVNLKYFGLNFQRHASQAPTMLTLDYSGESKDRQRIMGIAAYDGTSGKFVRDPHLYWTVPERWPLEAAVTIPCAYAHVYYSLYELSQMHNHPIKSMLITCPLTSVGQAYLNVAQALKIAVIALVANEQERAQLEKLFPKLEMIIIEDPVSDFFDGKVLKHFPQGVDFIVSNLSGARLRAATACYNLNGRLMQLGTDSNVSSDFIRLGCFLRATHVFLLTDDRLRNLSIEVKRRVVQWVQEGIVQGVVQPNVLRKKYFSSQYNEALRTTKSDAAKRIITLEEEKKSGILSPNISGRSAVIIGGSKAQWIRLAHHLARKGCKQITSVQDQSSPHLAARHAHILFREFGTELKELTNVKRGVDLIGTVSSTGTVFAFAQNNLTDEVVREMESRGLKDTQVLFFSKLSTHLSRMCERWVRKGLKIRAAVGVEDVAADSVTPMLGWLLSPAAPTVAVLNGPVFLFKKLKFASLSESRLLPSSVMELLSLGAYLRGKTMPAFRELITGSTCLKKTLEVQPLFFFKGIHGSATEEMNTIAANFLAPIVEVTLHGPCKHLEDTAQVVVEGIQKTQARGPYNLAGDLIRTDIITKVASILEEKGHASAVFLMDEGLDLIREELTLWKHSNKLNVSLLKSGLFEELTPQNWKSTKWSQFSWQEQQSIAVSHIHGLTEEQRQDVIIALDHVRNSVAHIIEAQDKIDLKHCIVRSLRRGDEYQKFKLREGYIAHTVPASKLKQKDIADVICPYLATPVLQLNIVKAQRRFKDRI